MAPKNLLHRVSWGLLDQVVSSLTNLILTLLVAHAVSPSDFGAFSLAFATYVLAQGSARAVAAEPLLILYSGLSDEAFRAKARLALGAGLGLGVVFGIACLAVGTLTGETLGHVFVALGVALPALIFQDVCRYTLVAANRADKAFFNDLLWGITLFTLVPLLLAWNVNDAGLLILAWGGTAALACVLGVVQVGTILAPLSLYKWWTDHRRLALPYVLEFVAATGAIQLTLYGVAIISGLVAAGSLRAATVILGPASLIAMGVRLIAIPEGRRLLEKHPNELQKTVRNVSAALAGLTLTWGLSVSLLPDAIGHLLLNDIWFFAKSLILPMTFVFSFSSFILGSVMGLRTLAAAKQSLKARTVTSVLIVCLGLAGAALGSAIGAATGLALAHAIGARLYWKQLTIACMEHTEGTGPLSSYGGLRKS